MPYKSGTLKGELTGAELRKLIRAHNILVSIKIPKGTDRDGLIKLIEKHGYKIDHKHKKIVDKKTTRPRRPVITLEKAKELTKPKPVTELQKQKTKEKKEEKEIQKKKEVRQIKKEAIKKEKEVQKKKKDIKDKLLSKSKSKEKMPSISTQTETPKKKQVLKLPSQKPKKIIIDKSKKPPMNIKEIEPKKKELKKTINPLIKKKKKWVEENEEHYKNFSLKDLEANLKGAEKDLEKIRDAIINAKQSPNKIELLYLPEMTDTREELKIEIRVIKKYIKKAK